MDLQILSSQLTFKLQSTETNVWCMLHPSNSMMKYRHGRYLDENPLNKYLGILSSIRNKNRIANTK